MSRMTSARRYAQAVYQIATEKNNIEQWVEDLSILSASTLDPDFLAFVNSPNVGNEKKTSLIKDVFSGHVNVDAMNLCCLLSLRNSVSILPKIADYVQEFLDADKGIERAEIVTAVQLTKQQREKIKEYVSSIVGKELTLTNRVEADILGGFLVRVGDRVMDGSLRTRIEDMKREVVG